MENSIEQLVWQVCQATGRESAQIRAVSLLRRIGKRLNTTHDVQKPWLIAFDDDTLFFIDLQHGKASDVLGYSSSGKLETYAQHFSPEILLKTITTLLLAEEPKTIGYVSSFFLKTVEKGDSNAHAELVKMVEAKTLTIISRCAVIALYQLWDGRALPVVCNWARGGLQGERKGEITRECFLCRAIYEELQTELHSHVAAIESLPVPMTQQDLV
ncbi:MAG: hypothetical protein WD972_01205 [Candidatus Andersenbacteria bacterium]